MFKVVLKKPLILPWDRMLELVGPVQQSSMGNCLFLVAIIEATTINRLYFKIKNCQIKQFISDQ